MSTSSVPRLELVGVSASWGTVPVVRSVSFAVDRGEILTLLGPNGSGKSTLLRVIAGFERPTAGAVRLDGRDLAALPPYRRSVGVLFQEPALFPNRTVYENVAYAPMLQRRPDAETRELVGRLGALLRLEPLLDRWPNELSGGEQQRVALARTLASRPKVVLLDEPFASVDVEVRGGLHAEFRAALREFEATVVHVTHDREEGLFFGDRLALLFEGAIDDVGPPASIYRRPRSERAARFLGYNILHGPDGAVAVLPDDLRPVASTTPRYRVLACGPVGRRYLAVLEDASGGRVEMRSDGPVVVGSTVDLEWTVAVPLH